MYGFRFRFVYMPLSIDYQLTDLGWADCSVQFADKSCKITASYLSDALGKLVVAANAVIAGMHSISIGFDEEPGEYRWVIRQTSGNYWLTVDILFFTESWGNRPDSEGEVVFSFACDPVEFVRAVRDAARQVLDRYGIAGYKEKWDAYDFPSGQLDLLDAGIAKWELEKPWL